MSLEAKVSDLQRKVRDLMVKKTERTRWEWGEETIRATALTLGATAPTLSSRLLDTGSVIAAPTLDFSSVTTQNVFYLWHVPKNLNSNQPIYFHVMWIPGASWTSGNFYLQFYYRSELENATLPYGTYTVQNADVTPTSATKIIETEYPLGYSVNPDDLLGIMFRRNVSLDNGNDVLQLFFLEIKYAYWL